LPSGAKLGWTHWPRPVVTCTALRPSASITKICQFPDRVEQNAIRLPSGLKAGKASSAGSLVSCVTAVPSTRCMYRSDASLCRVLENTIHRPVGSIETPESSPSSSAVCCWNPASPAARWSGLSVESNSPKTLMTSALRCALRSTAHASTRAAGATAGGAGSLGAWRSAGHVVAQPETSSIAGSAAPTSRASRRPWTDGIVIRPHLTGREITCPGYRRIPSTV
jgi:hypothetical protein